MFETYQLSNRVNTIIVPQSDTQAVTVLVVFPVGSRYEPRKVWGGSHYIEHLMFKGTKKRKNTRSLTREIDRLGAQYNAFTGKEYTGYYIKVDAKYSSIAIDILSDMIYNSRFDAKEMEREKGVIVEEIRMYQDNPVMNIENIFEEVMYDGCPLGRDIAGTEKSVQDMKRSDVLAFKEAHYEPTNMTLVVAGKIDEQIKTNLEKYFGKKKSKRNQLNSYKPFAFGSGKKEQRILVQKKETDQVQLMLGFPGLKKDVKESPIMSVMNTIIGGSMSSRLFIQIRERRGLAYMVGSGAESYRDTGYAFVRAGLEKKNLNKAIKVIGDEIDKLKSKGVSARELKDAKTHTRGVITLAMEDSGTQANWYATQALFMEKIETPEEKLKKIEKVTADQIKKLANKIYNMDKMRVGIIGNLEAKEVQF